jgi:hypothetical protein
MEFGRTTNERKQYSAPVAKNIRDMGLALKFEQQIIAIFMNNDSVVQGPLKMFLQRHFFEPSPRQRGVQQKAVAGNSKT